VRKTLARSIREARGLAARSLWEARPLLEKEYGNVLS
jgi:hypothetical protein